METGERERESARASLDRVVHVFRSFDVRALSHAQSRGALCAVQRDGVGVPGGKNGSGGETSMRVGSRSATYCRVQGVHRGGGSGQCVLREGDLRSVCRAADGTSGGG